MGVGHSTGAMVVFALLSAAAAANILLQHNSAPKRPAAPTIAAAVPRPMADVPVRPEVRQGVVRELYGRGYLTGAESELGPLVVESAILAFEHDHGLPLTAEPSEAVLQGLILGTAGGAERAVDSPGPYVKQLEDALRARLSKLGYPANPDLATAIRNFERDYRLPSTGRITAGLTSAINRATAVRGLATAR